MGTVKRKNQRGPSGILCERAAGVVVSLGVSQQLCVRAAALVVSGSCVCERQVWV